MTSLPSLPNSVSDEATRWFLRLRDLDCTEQEKREFERWLATDASHRHEYTALLTVWNRMEILTTPPIPELKQLKQRVGVHPLETTPQTNASKSRRIWTGLSGVAAMLLLAIGMTWWWTSFRTTVSTYHTARGEQRTVLLTDGTVMELNTNTAVTVRFSGRERQVVVDLGEVYFTVATDQARPFEVIAATGRIQDIGTQFTVHKQEDRVVVAVEQGVVRIDLAPPSSRSKNERWLTRGERAVYTPNGTWSTLDRVEPRQVATWRHGSLLLDDVPLAEAIRDVNRYWPIPIILVDPTLGTIRIKGVFKHRNLDEFFIALPKILPVEVVHLAGVVIITRK